MEASLHRSPHTADEVARARTVVTTFDEMLRTYGPDEAGRDRDDAWRVLRDDHAARRAARTFPFRHRATPGDAA